MIIGIEMVTNLIGRCAIYEELYPESTRVKDELVLLSAKILTYLITAKRFYSLSTAGMIYPDSRRYLGCNLHLTNCSSNGGGYSRWD